MSNDEAANETDHTNLMTQLCDCSHFGYPRLRGDAVAQRRSQGVPLNYDEVLASATHDDQPSATPLPPLVWLSFFVMISTRSAAAVSAAATAPCTVLA
jgi:hypothetical protein